MRQNKLFRSLRTIAAAAALSVAPVVFTASSANALAIGQTICYTADGTPVFNPTSGDGYDHCVTRAGGTRGTGLVVCTITNTSSSCTPIQPLEG